jgi:hypothetical protein
LDHKNPVVHATFSPDGQRILTVARYGIQQIVRGMLQGGEARVWDAATGMPLTPPLDHKNPVVHAAFSPDGRRVVTAGGGLGGGKTWGAARVWDASTGRPITPPLTHQRAVLYVAFSPDGRHVLTASEDGTARVWDAATGKPLTPPLQHQGATMGQAVYHAAFSPDGRRVVTASEDGTARVWDAATGKPLTPPLAHRNMVRHAAFSPDGRHVLTASYDQMARVWDTATGRPVTPPLRHGDRPPLLHAGRVIHAAFSPGGQWVVTTSDDKTARVWDLSPDSRPSENWVVLAQLWSARRVDASGALVPLTTEEFLQAWQQLRSRYPQDCTVSKEQAIAWHRREMEDCIRERNQNASNFHAEKLGLPQPKLPAAAGAARPGDGGKTVTRRLEAETLRVLDSRDCKVHVQDMKPWPNFKWSNGRHLFCWARQGGYVELEVEMARVGQYRLDVYFTEAPDFGIVEVSLGGRKLGSAFDTYHDSVRPSLKVSYGVVQLTPGSNCLRFMISGKNVKSTNFFLGIDCLDLSPVQ